MNISMLWMIEFMIKNKFRKMQKLFQLKKFQKKKVKYTITEKICSKLSKSSNWKKKSKNRKNLKTNRDYLV